MRLSAATTEVHAPRSRPHRRRLTGIGIVVSLGIVVSFVVPALLATSARAQSTSPFKAVSSGAPLLKVHFPTAISHAGGPAKRPSRVTTGPLAAPFPRGDVSVVFYDGFESGMGNWTVFGTPTWADSTYGPIAGFHDCYCAGSTIAAPGPYANNMSAWMVAGPIDLSTVTSAALWYTLFVNTEKSYDYVNVGVSLDGANFYMEAPYSGPLGQLTDTFDFANVPEIGNVCGHSAVWIAFEFTSDASGTGEGAYVDDVSLESGPRPVYTRIAATPAVSGYGRPATITGLLSDTWGNPLPNRPTELYASYDKANWTDLGSITTSSSGQWSRTWKVYRKTTFAIRFLGDSVFLPSDVKGDVLNSLWDEVTVTSRAYLTPPAVPAVAKHGVLYKRWGILKPRRTVAQSQALRIKYYVSRYSRGAWHKLYSGFASSYRNTSSATKYCAPFRPNLRGRYRIRAVFAKDNLNVATTSAWRYFRVR